MRVNTQNAYFVWAWLILSRDTACFYGSWSLHAVYMVPYPVYSNIYDGTAFCNNLATKNQ